MARPDRAFVGAFVLVCALLVALIRPASAAEPEFEQRIRSELTLRNAKAVRFLYLADEARDRGDYPRAAALYEQLEELVPRFYHAGSRLCLALVSQRKLAEALVHCRRALSAIDAVDELSPLARSLIPQLARSRQIDEAQGVDSPAKKLSPDDLEVLHVAAALAIQEHDFSAFREVERQLQAQAPHSEQVSVLDVVLPAMEGRFVDARWALFRARASGISRETYQSLANFLVAATPWPYLLAFIGVPIIVAWATSFGLLVLVGSILSRSAYQVASSPPAMEDVKTRGPFTAGSPAGGRSKLYLRLYRTVLWLCCAFYYVSLPLIGIVVAGLTATLFIASLTIRTFVPVYPLLVLSLIAATTVVTLVQSFFVRPSAANPGPRLDLGSHPRFRAVLAEVADRTGTPHVDTVFMTSGHDLAVTERGRARGLFRTRQDRCLILGAGLLEGMTTLEFKSLLAHEHGHFSNEDVAGGRFALSVRRSLETMALGLLQARIAGWYNPAWWFFRGFHRVFLVISQGASRFQEVLADRQAVLAYGSEPFVQGLCHIIAQAARFDAHVDATIEEVVRKKTPLLNLYRYEPKEVKDPSGAIAQALTAKPSAFDSHPAPKDRVRWAKALAVPTPPHSNDDDGPAWNLFEDRRAIEEEMTDVFRTVVRESRCIMIRKPPKVKDGRATAPIA